MFARTKRLMLRHGWPEDGQALKEALVQDQAHCNPNALDWPTPLVDVATYLRRERTPTEIDLLIFRRTDGCPELIGGVAIAREGPDHRFGCWLRPHFAGQGYGVEAGQAVLAHARDVLRIDEVIARSLGDSGLNALFGRLGFQRLGDEGGRAAPCGRDDLWMRYRRVLIPFPVAA